MLSEEELTRGMCNAEIGFYRECSELEGVSFEIWLKNMVEGVF